VQALGLPRVVRVNEHDKEPSLQVDIRAAPEPEDVLWKDLEKDIKESLVSACFSYFVLLCILAASAAIVVGVKQSVEQWDGQVNDCLTAIEKDAGDAEDTCQKAGFSWLYDQSQGSRTLQLTLRRAVRPPATLEPPRVIT